MCSRVHPEHETFDMPKRLNHLRALGVTPKVIYDVGAAQGNWAKLAASTWPSAHIVGFEPNLSNRDSLEDARNTLPKFQYFMCLLGACHKTVEYEEKGNQTSLYDLTPSGSAKATAEMLVLDEMVAEQRIPPPDFIKLDVQGYGGGAERSYHPVDHCEVILSRLFLSRASGNADCRGCYRIHEAAASPGLMSWAY